MSHQLSANFNESEFRCPCCLVTVVQPALVVALEALRAKVGSPILIRSGYRCPKHNAEVGGVPRSQHVLGTAADISALNRSGRELFEMAQAIPAFNGLGVAPTWIHVDVRSAPRVRWGYRFDTARKVWAEVPWKD